MAWTKAFLVFFLAMAPQQAEGGTLGYPTEKHPTDAQTSPLKDFSFLLTFSEVVQYAAASVTTSITVRKSDGTLNHAAISCKSASTMDLVSKYAVVPVTSELASNTAMKIRIPSNCFRSAAFESLADTDADYDFTTITKGTSVLQYDLEEPSYLSPTGNPSTPLDQAWVGTGQLFTLPSCGIRRW
jgi:hypothetical protein